MWQPTIVLPSWHLEDVARETSENNAASVLNAYALGFHPAVLAAGRRVPAWKAAGALESPIADQVVLLPEASRGKVAADWLSKAEEAGTLVVNTTPDRTACLRELLKNPRLREQLENRPHAAEGGQLPESLDTILLAEDFMALGVVYLLTSLLSQAMYHYDNIQETRFDELLIDAAEEAVRGDAERARHFLQQACEQLLESREKFYPVDAHLIDLCLLTDTLSPEDAESLASVDHTVNLLCSSEALERATEKQPEVLSSLRQSVHEGKLAVIGGERNDTPTPLLPIQTLRRQLERGMHDLEASLETHPQVWGRTTYGLSTQMPLLLRKFGIKHAFHLVLDDGIYPDEEQSHFLWEGRSGSTVHAVSRIPLSIEKASSVLKIPERLAEAMNHDHLACAILARWPKVKNPWFGDILGVQAYAPILGKFIGMSQFLEETDDSGHTSGYEQRFYLSPSLDHMTGRNEPDAITRFSTFWQIQNQLSVLSWLTATQQLFKKSEEDNPLTELEDRLQSLAPKLRKPELKTLSEDVNVAASKAAGTLSRQIASRQSGPSGFVVFNPLAHAHTRVLTFPVTDTTSPVPVVGGPVKFLQIESDAAYAAVELPACGFVTIASQPARQATTSKSKVPMAGEFFLQSEFFHVQIDPETGGVQRFRAHGSTENLLSERLVYRLDGDGGGVARSASAGEPRFSQMIADSITTTRTGPVVGEIEVRGRLVDPSRERVLANFTKRYRVYRGRRNLEISVSIDPQQLPAMLPDRSYYALRFAWGAAGASVKGSLQQSEFHAGERRLESTGPIEVEDEDHRLTFVPHHRPFHQRSGMRMLESLLIVHGESTRDFQFDVGLDVPQSAAFAEEVTVPPVLVPAESVAAGQSAWLYHVNLPNVRLVHAVEEDVEDSEQGRFFRFDFLETEGRHANARFSLFRKPKKAWEVDFLGKTQSELTIEDDTVRFECLPCDYLSIRVQF
ncbi:glycoside hydrolase family 38 N-terminal domain-containing protein [Rubinisphaera margarita]|uniref:glycoside hydrolase family 38 N-terminal domain-containing protein n=1 Tax=Rubinisphaera margarita TaxID=2909586 RepID=UPI001EE8F8CE|nr:hypothetical protein [Rubinisphaera margarita]MCG6156022.1 hypothetical protein [Rubinisphaera margarita]